MTKESPITKLTDVQIQQIAEWIKKNDEPYTKWKEEIRKLGMGQLHVTVTVYKGKVTEMVVHQYKKVKFIP
jgi:hypothetical protein